MPSGVPFLFTYFFYTPRMEYKSSAYYFMVFIVISVGFLSFIPVFRRKLSQTEEEFLHSHMRIAQSNILDEKVRGRSLDMVCITDPDVLFVENLATQDEDSYVCRDSDDTFALAVKRGRGWYCVDSEGFDGYVEGNEIDETCTS